MSFCKNFIYLVIHHRRLHEPMHQAGYRQGNQWNAHSYRTWTFCSHLTACCLFVACYLLGAQAFGEPAGLGCVDGLTLAQGKYLSAGGWAVGKDTHAKVKSIRFYASQGGSKPVLVYEDTPLAAPRPDVILVLQRPGLEKSQPGWALPLSRLYGKLRPGWYLFSVKAVMTDGEVISLTFSSPTAAEVTVP